jgi:phosphatidylserine/phosphatidylglycerophosphate/cardiolipin synthase-like enzyme
MGQDKTSLVLDDAYRDALLPLIQHAKKSVDVLAYSFAIGSAGGRLNSSGAPFKIAEELILAKKRGVDVRCYLEMERETASRNIVTARLLKKSKIAVKAGQTHAKGFLIDDKLLLFGSTNLTNQSLLKNRETNVLTNDKPAVQQFKKYFLAMWEGANHGDVTLKPPLYADGDFLPALIDLIDRAKHSLTFSIYFFDLKEVAEALIRAHLRGVKILGNFGRHRSFALSYVYRTVATAKRLSRAGIQDLYYGSPNSFTHSKYIVRDGQEIMLGTGNWLAEDVLIHPQLYIVLRNKPLALNLNRHLKRQIKEEGRTVARPDSTEHYVQQPQA